MTLRCELLLPVMIFGFAAAVAQPHKSDICPSDEKEFIAVQQRAEARDAAAQMALASCYDLGQHVQPDGKKSIQWLTEAAGQGYTPAEYELGRIYLYGRGIPVNYDQALIWERRAAEKGDPRAQRDLAFIYERGFGVAADPAKAAEWNRKAAAHGQVDAQVHLAQALDEGAGIRKNSDEAREWYGKAAKQDQPAAQLGLARKYAQASDCPRAIHWYTEAASHADTAAIYELGKLYLTRECGSDKSRALAWFTIGARFGSAESKAAAEGMHLTPVQTRRARAIAEQWIKEHPGAGKDEDEGEMDER